jgi:hypothetical protein
MNDLIQHVRDARPEAAGPRDEVVESARTALMAEVTRGRPPRRWGRRRVLGLAAPALAAGVTAVVLTLSLTGGSDESARAAAIVRAAEAAPRLLVDEPGWHVIDMRGFSESSGAMTLAKGKRRLHLDWLPKEQYQEAVLRGIAEMDDLGSVPAAGDDARLFRRRGTSEFIALWVRGKYMIEARGKAMNTERFGTILASLHQVDTERWLDLIPERIELVGDSNKKAIERSRGAPTALSQMSVFGRPPTDADVLPKRLYYRMGPQDPCPTLGRTEAFCRGSNVPKETRLLLSDLGVGKTTLYGWPTTEGWVCWAWDVGAGGCAPNFANDDRVPVLMTSIDPDKLGVGAPGVIVGIVPDDVVAASVRLDGVEYPAVVDRNGFFFELPTAKCSPKSFDSVWLTFRDGHREGKRLTLGGPVYPGDPPPPKCP